MNMRICNECTIEDDSMDADASVCRTHRNTLEERGIGESAPKSFEPTMATPPWRGGERGAYA